MDWGSLVDMVAYCFSTCIVVGYDLFCTWCLLLLFSLGDVFFSLGVGVFLAIQVLLLFFFFTWLGDVYG